MLGAIRTNVYFPAYSNGLKDIASFLGVNWTGKVTSGIDCIAARMRWEESRDSAIKEEILDYNRQDCLALQRVANFLVSLGSSEATADPLVQQASEIRVESHGRFGKIEFAIPEMNFINKCARFDYQRDKVLASHRPCRAGECSTKASQKHDPFGEPTSRFDASLRLAALAAEHPNHIVAQVSRISKLVYDLKFTRTGVKRWVIRYYSQRSSMPALRKDLLLRVTTQRTRRPATAWQAGRSTSMSPFGSPSLTLPQASMTSSDILYRGRIGQACSDSLG